MQKIRLVIFDIGGTIIEDNGEVIASFSAALKANGLEASQAELTEMKGSSKRAVITKFVERQCGKDPENEARIAKAYEDFKKQLESTFSNGGVKPIHGAVALSSGSGPATSFALPLQDFTKLSPNAY